MFHTIAWRVSTTTAVETDLTPVPDGIKTIQNGHFLPQVQWMLHYAYLGAADPVGGRIRTPTLRQMSTPWIRPVSDDIVPGAEPRIDDFRSNPLRLMPLEEIEVLATQDSGGAGVIVVVAGVSEQPLRPAQSAEIIAMRGTGATTATAGQWTLCTVTWQDTLANGLYNVVGLEFIGATALAARLQFEDQVSRPGCVGKGVNSSRVHPMFQNGGLGVWGSFNANRMPNMQILCNAADTAQEFYLYFQRVG